MSFKKLIQFVFILTISFFSAKTVLAQDFKGKIENSMSSGSMKELSRNFDKRVQVTIDGKSSYYSGAQAELVLKEYLEQLGSRSFTLIKSGKTADGNAEFYIGEINCTKGQAKVYIYARKVSNTHNIQEIRIEKK